MNALRQEASQLLAGIPDQNLSVLIPYMKFLRRESQTNISRELDISKYAGSAGNLFDSDKEVDEYIKEMRNDERF